MGHRVYVHVDLGDDSIGGDHMNTSEKGSLVIYLMDISMFDRDVL
jgi:hypothetical protein